MRNLIIIGIILSFLFIGGCGKDNQNPIGSLFSVAFPPKTPDVALESTNEVRAVNGRYDGLLLVTACVGVFLCVIGRGLIGGGFIAAGVSGFVLLDILAVMRPMILIGGVVAIIGGVGYLVWHLYNKQTLKGSFKFT